MGFNTHGPLGTTGKKTRLQNGHEAYLNTYFRWLDAENPAEPLARRVTVIARSPASPVIQAIQALADGFQARDISVQAVFSDVEPEEALRDAWQVIAGLSPGREHGDLLRWANSPGILEAHEQVVMGARMSWLGDAMRREPGRRDGFDIFETDAPEPCRLAMQAFDAMWSFAGPLPGWILRESNERQPGATYAGPGPRALATLSYFRKLEKPDTLCH